MEKYYEKHKTEKQTVNFNFHNKHQTNIFLKKIIFFVIWKYNFMYAREKNK